MARMLTHAVTWRSRPRVVRRLLAVTAGLGAAALLALLTPPDSGSAQRAGGSATAYAQSGCGGGTRAASISRAGTARGPGATARVRTSGRQGSASAVAKRSGSIDPFDDGSLTATRVEVSARSAGGGATVARGRVVGLRIGGRSRGTITSPRTFKVPGHGQVRVLQGRAGGIAGLQLRCGVIAFARARGRDGSAPARSGDRRARQDSSSPAARPERGGRPGGRGRSRGRVRSPAADGAGRPGAGPTGPAPRREAPELRALRTQRGYAFPVYGKTSYSNDWGAPRQFTVRHEGTDIFAAAGAPVVAVTGGTLNRVGTKKIPGNRLWLRADNGDEFFYAHLSAFAKDARNGRRVEPGDVLGFNGSTGDAEKTPPHLHFEVHPRGGDAVNPFPFLRAWEGRRDVPPTAWAARYGQDPGARPGSLVVVRDFLAE